MNCTFEEIVKNDPIKLQAIQNTIKPWHSWYFDMRFLRQFYTMDMAELKQPIQTHVYNCYERLLDYWLAQRQQRIKNEQQVASIAFQLDELKKEPDIFSTLLTIGVVFVTGYLINAIKK